jgi:uncharacterized membrane protein
MSFKSKSVAAENINNAKVSAREPSPVVVIAAFTESMRVMLNEIRGLASETFAFQLKLMELIPEADRLAAFKAVLETHQHEVAADERIALALISMTEKLGVAASAIIPPALMLRQAEINERQAEREERAEERARIAAEEAERKVLDALRASTTKPYVNGNGKADAK